MKTPMRLYSLEEIFAELQSRIEARSQKAVAQELGVTEGHLSNVLSGQRAIGPKIMAALGFTIPYIRVAETEKEESR